MVINQKGTAVSLQKGPEKQEIADLQQKINKGLSSLDRSVRNPIQEFYNTEITFYSHEQKKLILKVILELLNSIEATDALSHNLRQLNRGIFRGNSDLLKLAQEVMVAKEAAEKHPKTPPIFEYGRGLLFNQIEAKDNKLSLKVRSNAVRAAIKLIQAARELQSTLLELEQVMAEQQITVSNPFYHFINDKITQAKDLLIFNASEDMSRKTDEISQQSKVLRHISRVIQSPDSSFALLVVEINRLSDDFGLTKKLVEFYDGDRLELAASTKWPVYKAAQQACYDQLVNGKINDDVNLAFIQKLQNIRNFINELSKLQTVSLNEASSTNNPNLNLVFRKILGQGVERLTAAINNNENAPLDGSLIEILRNQIDNTSPIFKELGALHDTIVEAVPNGGLQQALIARVDKIAEAFQEIAITNQDSFTRACSNASQQLSSVTERFNKIKLVMDNRKKLQASLSDLSEPNCVSLEQLLQTATQQVEQALATLDLNAGDGFEKTIADLNSVLETSNSLAAAVNGLQERIRELTNLLSNSNNVSQNEAWYKFATMRLDECKGLLVQPATTQEMNQAVLLHEIMRLQDDFVQAEEKLQGVIVALKTANEPLQLLVTAANSVLKISQKLQELNLPAVDRWQLLSYGQESIDMQLSILALGQKLTAEEEKDIKNTTDQLSSASELINKLYELNNIYGKSKLSQTQQESIVHTLDAAKTILRDMSGMNAISQDKIQEISSKLTQALTFVHNINGAQEAIGALRQAIESSHLEKQDPLYRLAAEVMSKNNELLWQLSHDDPQVSLKIKSIVASLTAAMKLLDQELAPNLRSLAHKIVELSDATAELNGELAIQVFSIVEAKKSLLLAAINEWPVPDTSKVEEELETIKRIIAKFKKLQAITSELGNDNPFDNIAEKRALELQGLLQQVASNSHGLTIDQLRFFYQQLSNAINLMYTWGLLKESKTRLQGDIAQAQVTLGKDHPLLVAAQSFLESSTREFVNTSIHTEESRKLYGLSTKLLHIAVLIGQLKKLHEYMKFINSTVESNKLTVNELFEDINKNFDINNWDRKILHQDSDLFDLLINNNFPLQGIISQSKALDVTLEELERVTKFIKKLRDSHFFEKRHQLKIAIEGLQNKQAILDSLNTDEKSLFIEITTSLVTQGNELLQSLKPATLEALDSINNIDSLITQINEADKSLSHLGYYKELATKLVQFPKELDQSSRTLYPLLEKDLQDALLSITSWQSFIDAKELLRQRFTGQVKTDISPDSLNSLTALLYNSEIIKDFFNELAELLKLQQQIDETQLPIVMQVLSKAKEILAIFKQQKLTVESFTHIAKINKKLRVIRQALAQLHELQAAIAANFQDTNELVEFGNDLIQEGSLPIIEELSKAPSDLDGIQRKVISLQNNLAYFKKNKKTEAPPHTKEIIEDVLRLLAEDGSFFATHEKSSRTVLAKIKDLYSRLLFCENPLYIYDIFLILDSSVSLAKETLELQKLSKQLQEFNIKLAIFPSIINEGKELVNLGLSGEWHLPNEIDQSGSQASTEEVFDSINSFTKKIHTVKSLVEELLRLKKDLETPPQNAAQRNIIQERYTNTLRRLQGLTLSNISLITQYEALHDSPPILNSTRVTTAEVGVQVDDNTLGTNSMGEADVENQENNESPVNVIDKNLDYIDPDVEDFSLDSISYTLSSSSEASSSSVGLSTVDNVGTSDNDHDSSKGSEADNSSTNADDTGLGIDGASVNGEGDIDSETDSSDTEVNPLSLDNANLEDAASQVDAPMLEVGNTEHPKAGGTEAVAASAPVVTTEILVGTTGIDKPTIIGERRRSPISSQDDDKDQKTGAQPRSSAIAANSPRLSAAALEEEKEKIEAIEEEINKAIEVIGKAGARVINDEPATEELNSLGNILEAIKQKRANSFGGALQLKLTYLRRHMQVLQKFSININTLSAEQLKKAAQEIGLSLPIEDFNLERLRGFLKQQSELEVRKTKIQIGIKEITDFSLRLQREHEESATRSQNLRKDQETAMDQAVAREFTALLKRMKNLQARVNDYNRTWSYFFNNFFGLNKINKKLKTTKSYIENTQQHIMDALRSYSPLHKHINSPITAQPVANPGQDQQPSGDPVVNQEGGVGSNSNHSKP